MEGKKKNSTVQPKGRDRSGRPSRGKKKNGTKEERKNPVCRVNRVISTWKKGGQASEGEKTVIEKTPIYFDLAARKGPADWGIQI